MCAYGETRAWFVSGKSVACASYITKEEIDIHNKIFAHENGGHGPPLKWYKAQIANLDNEDDATIPPERLHVQQRTLLVTCSNDFIVNPAVQVESMRPFVKNLKVETMDTGHWLLIEKPEEVNAILKNFFEETEDLESTKV